MRKLFSTMVLLSIALALGGVQPAVAQTPFYTQHNLISDDATVIAADLHNNLLVNPWGLVSSPTSPWWIANNGSDTSILYNANTKTIQSLVVSIPGGRPTGIVFNNSGGGFVVANGAACVSAACYIASA